MLKRKLKKRKLIDGCASIILAAGIVVTGAVINDKLNIVKGADYYLGAAGVNEDKGACGFTAGENSLTFYVKNAKFADLHYMINGGEMVNVSMQNDADGNFSYTVEGLKKGDTIKYFFTYDPGKGALDTSYLTYTFQGSCDVPVINQGGSSSSSTNTDDFTASENSLKFYVKNAKFADLHYIVNGGAMVNVAMQNDGYGNFSYTVDSLKKGDTIKYFFTYDLGKGALDTDYSTYTFQGKDDESVDNPGGNSNSPADTDDNNNNNDNNGNNNSNDNKNDSNNGNSTSTPSNGYVVPSIDSSFIPVTNPASRDYNSIFMQLNNKTNGKYSDSQIYWCIIGLNANKEWSYLDSNGNLVPLVNAEKEAVSTPMGNTRVCSKIYNKLSEKKNFYLPSIESGRMYISYCEPIHITVNNGGYAGPDLNNADDPNQNTYFEFIEFTTSSNTYGGADHGKESVWINTSRVDFYSFPVVARLVGRYDSNSKNFNYDKTVGDLGNRNEMFNGFRNNVPDEFKALANERRIMAPCKSVFNEGQANAHYFDRYIDAFWDKYSKEDLVFKCEAGNYRGRIVDGVLKFTKDEDPSILGYVYKPTTQDVLEGKGSFDKRTNITNEASGVQELVVEAQLCAAFNRGVALHPELWNNADFYYKGSNGYDNLGANFYSAYLHEKAINNKTYGFCYDDVNDWSSSMYCADSKAFILDLGW